MFAHESAGDMNFVAEYHSDSVTFFMSYDGHVVTPSVTAVDVSLGAQGQRVFRNTVTILSSLYATY